VIVFRFGDAPTGKYRISRELWKPIKNNTEGFPACMRVNGSYLKPMVWRFPVETILDVQSASLGWQFNVNA
jgi:hypothetical protein